MEARKTYGYIRIVKDTDAPVEQQRRKIEAWAELHERAPVHDVLVDHGPDYRGFDQLIGLVGGGEVAAIIAMDLARVARDRAELHHLLSLCTKHETALCTVVLDIDTAALSGAEQKVLLDSLRSGISGDSEATASALARKRRAGFAYTKTPPYGYRRDSGQFVEDPHEQLWLETMRKMREEDKTYDAIAAALAEMGSTNRNGDPWTRQNIRKVLNSRKNREARPS